MKKTYKASLAKNSSLKPKGRGWKRWSTGWAKNMRINAEGFLEAIDLKKECAYVSDTIDLKYKNNY